MSQPLPRGTFLLGCDYSSFPNKQLREWVWSRQTVNANTHRILVEANDHGSEVSYWYWAVSIKEMSNEPVV